MGGEVGVEVVDCSGVDLGEAVEVDAVEEDGVEADVAGAEVG